MVSKNIGNDKNAVSITEIQIRSIDTISLEQQMRLREIRNEPSIREVAFTDHEISEEEHLQWIQRIKTDNRQIVFAIIRNVEQVIGIISLIALDLVHGKAEWSFYLAESERGGIGTAIEWHFMNFVFNRLNLQKLNGEILACNKSIIPHHKKFAFKEEGIRRSNVIKNGKRVDVHLVGLTQLDWLAHRMLAFEKHQHVLSKYDIHIFYENN